MPDEKESPSEVLDLALRICGEGNVDGETRRRIFKLAGAYARSAAIFCDIPRAEEELLEQSGLLR